MEEKTNGVTGEQQQKTDAGRRKFLASSAVFGMGLPLASLVNSKIVQAAEAQKVPAPAASAAAAPAAPRAKALLVERRRCTGCNSCVFACSLFHDGVVRPSTARLRVLRHQSVVDVPIICWHCPDAPCVEACPTTPKAIVRDPATNVVKFVDEKMCTQCGNCIAACPPEFLRAHPDTGSPLFCDLCDGDPQCVKACDRQSKETGQTLRSDPQIGGLHLAYREVTPQDAINGLMVNMYYPNLDGKRR
ncbi:MAG: 4Fe-4S dicluster domain-containing protein [Deltaproteobacteria bacterium]|jgi:Fe-S-cluster-containing hydrogenase component 2|nr:4Fe-4S dicluster domain-containing protein [Deltaproteobacteria bacterium]